MVSVRRCVPVHFMVMALHDAVHLYRYWRERASAVRLSRSASGVEIAV